MDINKNNMPSLVDFNRSFLDKSWEWLNDPEIKALTMTPDFTKEDQLHFYNSLPLKKNYWIKGITEDGIPVGAMGLKNIDTEKSEAEYWGYIGEKNYWGKGIGSFMIAETITAAIAFGLKKIYLHVDAQNKKAVKLYIHKGFRLQNPGVTEKYQLDI